MGDGKGGMIWENSIETCILSIVKQIISLGWMHETSAQGWCTKTQRDGMGREMGGGFRMGNTCKSMAESCQCMAKTTKYYKAVSLQLTKINKKKKKRRICLAMQGTLVLSLVQEDPTCHGATRPVCHNYWASALEPTSHDNWGDKPQLLKPVHLEHVLYKRDHHSKRPKHCNQRVVPTLQN